MNRLTSQASGGALRIAGTLDEAATMTIQGKPATVDATNRFQGTVPVTNGTTTVAMTATDGSGNQSTNTYEVDLSGTGATLTYDANGNLTGDGMRTFTWDAENRLLAVAIGTKASEFSYDGHDRRVHGSLRRMRVSRRATNGSSGASLRFARSETRAAARSQSGFSDKASRKARRVTSSRGIIWAVCAN